MVLRVSYPEAYPDVAPDLDLTTAHNAKKYDHFDVHEDKTQLLQALQPTIEENLGMPMIFTLVTTLKENAESLITDRLQAVVKIKEAKAAEAEAEENRKFQGAAVTRESFVEWMTKFKAEMAEEEQRQQEAREAEEKKKRVTQKEKKLTGRELWERGIAQGGDEEDSEEEEADAKTLVDGVSELNVKQ